MPKPIKVDYTPQPSAFRVGEQVECPKDGSTMTFRSGLTLVVDTPTGRRKLTRLRGFKCPTCPNRHWDGPGYDRIIQAKEPSGPTK